MKVAPEISFRKTVTAGNRLVTLNRSHNLLTGMAC